ncbi:hypothetical protein RB595_005917 [Gaeumannomyces hyphopodioides]
MLDIPQLPTKGKTQHVLPAVLIRAGSSKALFTHRSCLPEDRAGWTAVLLAVMSSPLCGSGQVGGSGGRTSIVVIVAPSTIPGIDVEFTSAQVTAGQDTLNFFGSCRNTEAGVGLFSVLEGFVRPAPGQRAVDVRIFNANTLAIVDLVGCSTGTMFPSGRPIEPVTVVGLRRDLPPLRAWVTLADAAEPCVLVDAATLPALFWSLPPESGVYADFVEAVRRLAAVRMGLAASVEAAARSRRTPRVALVSGPARRGWTLHVHPFDQGAPCGGLVRKTAVCVAVAACVPMTVPESVAEFPRSEGATAVLGAREPAVLRPDEASIAAAYREVRVGHAGGAESVSLWVGKDQKGSIVIGRDVAIRTVRRIWKGNILYCM